MNWASTVAEDGYVVVPGAVPAAMCQAVLDAIAAELGISVDDPATWDRVSSEIDQIPMWGHQSQWDIRQLPQLHRIWADIWGRDALWVDLNSCRFTPSWRPGRADRLPIHWDVDPWDDQVQWYPGVVALTDAGPGEGGFRCVPPLVHDREAWPNSWTDQGPNGYSYEPDVKSREIVEVPLRVGDLIVMDSKLPHGTVRNLTSRPRVAFYLQYFPAGTPDQAAERVADFEAGRCPSFWRWKPGHDRLESRPPATLNEHGRRLLGAEPWGTPGQVTER